MTNWWRVGKLKSYTVRDKNTLPWIRYGGWYSWKPTGGCMSKVTFMLYHLLWCPKALTSNDIFSSYFLFKVSKITWELCHNPLGFSVIVFFTTGCVLWVLCVSWSPWQRSEESKSKFLCWGPGCQFSCRQPVWCSGHIQKALFSPARLTIGRVYLEYCHRGVPHLSNLMITPLCRICSSAKT